MEYKGELGLNDRKGWTAKTGGMGGMEWGETRSSINITSASTAYPSADHSINLNLLHTFTHKTKSRGGRDGQRGQ